MNTQQIQTCLLDPEQAKVDKRTRILQATGRLLASEGFHGLSMSKLARAANVANGTLYLYFDDKADLLRQYHYEISKALSVHLLHDHDPADMLHNQYRKFWFNMINFMISWPDYFTTQTQYLASPFYDPDIHRENLNTMMRPIQAMFERGVHEKVLRPLPLQMLTVMSLEVSITMARKHQIGLLNLTPELAELACEQTWQSICLKPINE